MKLYLLQWFILYPLFFLLSGLTTTYGLTVTPITSKNSSKSHFTTYRIKNNSPKPIKFRAIIQSAPGNNLVMTTCGKGLTAQQAYKVVLASDKASHKSPLNIYLQKNQSTLTNTTAVATKSINWQKTNEPYGGYITDIIASPYNSNILYAASKGDDYIYNYYEVVSLYKSTNGGMSWHSINKGVFKKDIVKLIIYQGAIYAATKGQGILKSTDGGDTWIASNTGLHDKNVVSLTMAGTTLYTGTGGGGVYRS